MRSAFMGSPAFAVPSLQATADHTDLAVVVTQPDRPAGRGRKLQPGPVKVLAGQLGVPVLQPTKMKDGTLAAALRGYDLDVIVVVAFGRILPPEILGLPRHGCINVHASLLPRWRGAAPIQRAILAGDAETGVSIMKMDAGMDTGPVFRMVRTPIDPQETSGALFERLAELGATALAQFLTGFPDVAPPTDQPPDGVTMAAMLAKSEGRIAWDRPAQAIVDHVRGMDPWPAATTIRGDVVLKVFAARPSDRTVPPGTPTGTILGVDPKGLHAAAGDGAVALGQIQPPGKRRMDAQAYAAGRPVAPGERLQ